MGKQAPNLNKTRETTDKTSAELLTEEIKGTDRVVRLGERYFMSCHCGKFETTLDQLEVTKFLDEHWENCNGNSI